VQGDKDSQQKRAFGIANAGGLVNWCQRFASVRWSSIAGVVFFAAFILAMSRFWIPEEIRQLLKATFLCGTAAVVICRYASGFQGGAARFTASRSSSRSLVWSAMSVQPVEVFGAQRFVATLVLGFLRQLAGRTAPAPPNGEAFRYWRTSTYPVAAVVLAICLMIELPVGGLLMNGLGMAEAKREMLHEALLVLTTWAFVLGIGDRYWLKAGAHVLDAAHLHLQLGARVRGAIPLRLVTGALIEPWRSRGRSSRPKECILEVSPLDSPNLRLLLAPGALSSVQVRGAPVPDPVDVLDLRVDEPERLLALLATRGVPVSLGRS
jgi:hypothetical protein